MTSAEIWPKVLPGSLRALYQSWLENSFHLCDTALTLFPLILFLSRTFLWLLVAFIVLGFRETGEPPRKAMIVDLAPRKKRGESVEIYYALRGLAVMPAPILGGILWRINPQALFLLATVIGVVAILLLLTTVKEAHE